MQFRPPFVLCCGFLLMALPLAITHARPKWRSLDPGPSLQGWVTRDGKAPFTIEGEDIVGRSVLGSRNTFLVTRETFTDFILEYEAKVDPRLNSGVMVRAESRPDYRGGLVFGYRVEIDSSPRAWSGGIYDEQRREWLNTLARNPAARAAFKVGEWNRFRVEAIGDRIRTFVNGVAAANLIDNATRRGFIGLQVHSVDNDGPKIAGMEARFRGIRILTYEAAAAATALDPAAEEYNYLPNQLTDIQIAQGWRLLWDGVSTKGWRGVLQPAFPARGWVIRDGTLSVVAATGTESPNGGDDIITVEEFANFELELDVRVSPGANSGIKYFVDPQLGPSLGMTGWNIGPEFQILDDDLHPDAKLGVRGNRTLGSLYDLIPAANLEEPGRLTKHVLPTGEWNRARLVARGRHVEHWLNGVKVVEYERGTQMFRALVNNSKYKDIPSFGERERGHILLQDHGNQISFRSIKIRTLDSP